MDSLVYHNGRIIEAAEAKVAATLAGLQYGWGVFTTLRVHQSKVFAFDRHWDRLVRHAEKARVSLTIEKLEAEQSLVELIRANSLTNGRARLTVLKGAVGSWRTGVEGESEMLIFTAPEVTRVNAREFSLTVSPYRLLSSNPLAGVKRTAMLENLLAYEEARSRNFDEAVMLNERGEIVSATAGNIFWTDGKELHTPSLPTGCVAGITRGLVLEAARRINVHTVEGSFPLQSLSSAGEVFLTSTSRGITLIKSYDLRVFDSRTAAISKNLSREYEKLFAR